MAGCGKTYLLSQLSDRGEQILDLEGLAKEKDLIFGGLHNEDQPSQSYFESLIAKQFSSFDNNRIVWIETKNIRIGKLCVPQELFKKMCTSDCYIINLPMQERVNHIIRRYKYFTEDFEELQSRLTLLPKYHPSRKISEWISLAEKGQWQEFVEELLVNRSDPIYTRSQTRHNHGEKTSVVDLDDLSSESVHRCLKNMIEESRASVSEAISNE
ncbi:hypothetical protein FSP39_012999 [Pinctada imbricata]|uniref:tRNA 2-selenouridine synthase AAA domain-containing protein n=1 Tax=Pinctada imbricata TaxID=66713 RepID=A0AA89BX13_PINIB|nr:hypothetical protein FSP39_012999 [Pinctada imbricata]